MAEAGERVKPLQGVRVLDLSRMVAGGVAGMLLADFGADVVKVEQPGVGDPLRQWTAEGQPFWWKVYGRNKRFITLNLKSDEGRALLLRHDRFVRTRTERHLGLEVRLNPERQRFSAAVEGRCRRRLLADGRRNRAEQQDATERGCQMPSGHDLPPQ